MITQLLICPAGRKRKEGVYRAGSLRSERSLRELSVPIVMMTWHLVYSGVEEYIILTITVLLEMKASTTALWPLPLVLRVARILSDPGFLSSGATPI